MSIPRRIWSGSTSGSVWPANWLADEALAAALDEIETVNEGNQITVFEAITAAALLLFSRVPADLCVVEVGLGGRFDATNVVTPVACAITAISMDHQDFLGDTLGVIAAEKAGIIKPGIPVVTGTQEAAALAAITHEAETVGAPLLRRDRDWQVEALADGIRFEGLDLPRPALPGAHQVENAGIAMATLRAAGFNIAPAAFAAGLQQVTWPARLQRLNGALLKLLPPGSELWLDGAHNPGGAEVLATQLAEWPGPTTLVMGMKQSKDVAEVMRILRPHAARIFAVAEPGQHLALPVEAIIAASGDAALPGPDIAGALRQITAPTRVLICGSLYLAGEVLKLDDLSKEALLFVNKKKQKNFFNLGYAGATRATRNGLSNRSFLVLFFKKEPLPSFPLKPPKHHQRIHHPLARMREGAGQPA